MKKIQSLYVFLLLIVFSLPVSAQTKGKLIGKVVNSENNPIEFASVSLDRVNNGTFTNDNGIFIIDASAGDYTVTISNFGYSSIKKSISIEAGKTTDIGYITLNIIDNKLDEVTINAGFNKFSKKETDNVAKMPLKNLENPQVYNVIPKQLTQEQMIVDYNDILLNITGGNVSSSNNSSNQSMLRGFRSFNGVRSGITAYSMIAIDPANIESVEVIKGPVGTLFGGSTANLVTFGGLMNRVTKKPMDRFFGEVGYSGGSYALSRVTADINTPLDKDLKALARLNAAYHTENSFQDAGFQRNYLIAPSFSLQANDRLTLLFDAEIYRTERSLPPTFAFNAKAGGLTARNFKDLPSSYDRSFTSDDLTSKLGTNNFYAQANYILSDQWKSTTSYSYNLNEYYDAFRLYTSWQTDSTVMRAVMAQKPQRQMMTSVQQNFNGDFKIGNMRNRIVVGANYTYFKAKLRYTNLVMYDLVNINQSKFVDISRPKVDELLAKQAYINQVNEDKSIGVYASDVLDITDRLFLMVSLRFDHYKSNGVTQDGNITSDAYSQNSLSPKLGLVFQPIKDQVSLFVNYNNGFSNQNGADINGKSFKPMYAEQAEGGIKLELLKNKLNATISYYDINVTDVLRLDVNNPGFNIQDGKRKSRGFEAEFVINPFNGFNMLFGYGYNESRYTRSNENVEGKKPLGTPYHMANLWMSYKIPLGVLNGFGIGTGGNYASSSYFNDINTFTIPKSFVMNATLFYDKPKYRLGFKVNNLTNEKYWSYIGTSQNPRNIIFNFTYKFM